MIYLIDEKKERRNNYGWSEERLFIYADQLTVISDQEDLEKISSETILESNSNIVLLHDSFFNNINLDEVTSVIFKEKIRKRGLKLVTFGGSFPSIFFQEKLSQLPVKIFYNNLEFFLKDESKELKTIAYGKNSEEEEWLDLKNRVYNYLFRFSSNHILTKQEIFDLLDSVSMSEKIIVYTNSYSKVGDIKNILNKLLT